MSAGKDADSASRIFVPAEQFFRLSRKLARAIVRCMFVRQFIFPSRSRCAVVALESAGLSILRHEPCRFCGSHDGLHIFPVTFWDIETTNLVGCLSCRLVQLDPMLSDTAMSKGVYAYYLWQRAHESPRSQLKNALRNFRKGYAFARSLPNGFIPKRVLELGPGSGWFLRGVKEIFRDAEFSAWDMVPDVVGAMAAQHGFYPLSGDLSSLRSKPPFDLIIARDVIEHFADAGSALRQTVDLLKSGGMFHFITPNGHEDLWKFFVAGKLGYHEAGELLLNHVNYFDGAGLRRYLESIGLIEVEYYTYDFSVWKAGIGWRVTPKLAAGSHGLRADATVAECGKIKTESSVLVLPHMTWYRRLWYRFKGWRLLRLDPALNFGHEIHGVFRKV